MKDVNYWGQKIKQTEKSKTCSKNYGETDC